MTGFTTMEEIIAFLKSYFGAELTYGSYNGVIWFVFYHYENDELRKLDALRIKTIDFKIHAAELVGKNDADLFKHIYHKLGITDEQMSAISTYALTGCDFYDVFSVDIDWGDITFNQFIKGVEAYTAMYNEFCAMHYSDLC